MKSKEKLKSPKTPKKTSKNANFLPLQNRRFRMTRQIVIRSRFEICHTCVDLNEYNNNRSIQYIRSDIAIGSHKSLTLSIPLAILLTSPT